MSALDPRALRRAFGSFMTGVTVVTCKAADGTPLGFTANSFSSVSLDPPLLRVCPGRFLSSYDSFASCSHFAVNVLAEGQEDVANTFATFKGDRFARTPHRADPHGNVLIDGALAQFSCTTHQVVDAGDHAILLGEVRAFHHDAGRGLGYAGGQFFSLGLERAALDPAGNTALLGAIITEGDEVLLEKTDAGYRPPQVISTERQHVRRTLAGNLGSRGQPVRPFARHPRPHVGHGDLGQRAGPHRAAAMVGEKRKEPAHVACIGGDRVVRGAVQRLQLLQPPGQRLAQRR